MPVKSQDAYMELDAVVKRNVGQKGAVMRSLQEAQNIFGHVPKDVQILIAEGLGVTLSEVYGVATFYSQFALEPRGEHVIGVCLGTACYVKGSKNVLDKVLSDLKVAIGKTTSDAQFTIKDTRCLGACGLAPVMMIDEEVYGRLTPADIPGILDKYRKAQ